MNEDKTSLKPNDVAVILRPSFDDGVWDGGFEVIVSGFGPVTMKREDMDNLIGMAVLLASTVPLMEKDEEFSQKATDHCNEFYSEFGELEYNLDHDSFGDGLNINTKCAGGTQ
jgi:hypothetical protein